jgi:hypothetical protein
LRFGENSQLTTHNGPFFARSVCYNMCTQKAPYNWSEQLYQRHGEVRIINVYQFFFSRCSFSAMHTKNFTIATPILALHGFYCWCFDYHPACIHHNIAKANSHTNALHTQTIAAYLNNSVVSSLRELQGQGGEAMLREFVRRGANHNIMNEWYRKFFMYLVRINHIYTNVFCCLCVQVWCMMFSPSLLLFFLLLNVSNTTFLPHPTDTATATTTDAL